MSDCKSCDLETLYYDLQKVTRDTARESFTALFQRGCELLGLKTDDEIARAFDTSHPNANRWKNGRDIPPAANLILSVLRDLVFAKFMGH
jgi:hypothetical protein